MTTAAAPLSPEQLEAFEMPRPARGEALLWYPHGDRNETPEIGYVREVNRRGITLAVNGVAFAPVRHIDDPKLLLHSRQRENGAWEFPEDHNTKMQPIVADLRERLSVLERQVAALQEQFAAKAAPAKGKSSESPAAKS